MGFRTVVMLSNDQAGAWSKDAQLGQKILFAMNDPRPDGSNPFSRDIDGYGKIVECVHADTNTLALLSGYKQMNSLAHSQWSKADSDEEVMLRLLKDAAGKLGYKLVKSSK